MTKSPQSYCSQTPWWNNNGLFG